tara:strand:+ start:79 stop:297 length:219 start_codon:yes stop_codon:yes gene_type:complete
MIMEWISVEDRLPVDINSIKFYGLQEILIVTGCRTEYCEFTYGPVPEPWVKFDNFHKGFITHWMPLPEPPKE